MTHAAQMNGKSFVFLTFARAPNDIQESYKMRLKIKCNYFFFGTFRFNVHNTMQ